MLGAFQVFNGRAPSGVPKVIPLRFDISAVANYYIDLSVDEAFQNIEFIQSVFIDNAENPAAVTLTFEISGQRIIAPPLSQGYYTVFAPEQTKFTLSTTIHATAQPRVLLLNIPVACCIWKVA